ncbi:MAG: hypothetical protein JXQ93_14105 [Flavobacteriaceae bacterium]
MKKIIFLLSLFFSIYSFSQGQNDIKVKIKSKDVKSSLVYSIESKTPKDFEVYITSLQNDTKIIKKLIKGVVGMQYYKLDISTLPKVEYYFYVRDKNTVIFKEKIKNK